MTLLICNCKDILPFIFVKNIKLHFYIYSFIKNNLTVQTWNV